MRDKFESYNTSLLSPAISVEEINPNDANDLAQITRALYVGGAGNVRVKMMSGSVVTFANMLGGVCYPFRITKVFATGTTATNLVGVS